MDLDEIKYRPLYSIYNEFLLISDIKHNYLDAYNS